MRTFGVSQLAKQPSKCASSSVSAFRVAEEAKQHRGHVRHIHHLPHEPRHLARIDIRRDHTVSFSQFNKRTKQHHELPFFYGRDTCLRDTIQKPAATPKARSRAADGAPTPCWWSSSRPPCGRRVQTRCLGKHLSRARRTLTSPPWPSQALAPQSSPSASCWFRCPRNHIQQMRRAGRSC